MKVRIFLTGLLLFTTAFAADFPKLKGWKAESQVITYHPENLWKYINGAAEQFLAFDFQELTYRDISRKGLVVTVHIYDMGSPLNAYGIYTAERPDESDRHAIGGEAVILPPYQCLLLKDSYYVKIDAYEGEISEETGLDLVKTLADALPGVDGFPEELTRLPKENMIEGSQGYVRESFLGLGELTQCVFGKYKNDSSEFQRFIIAFDSGVTQEDVGDLLGERWKQRKYKGNTVLFREVPYRGYVGVAYDGIRWIGVADCKTEKELLERFGEILQ